MTSIIELRNKRKLRTHKSAKATPPPLTTKEIEESPAPRSTTDETLIATEIDELILKPNPRRFVLLPIKYHDVRYPDIYTNDAYIYY
jgi:hypothetical protein